MNLSQTLTELSQNTKFVKNLGNVLTLRSFGNKLHGDNLEIAMVEWIKAYTDLHSLHVGKDFFRSGENSDMIISENNEFLSMYIEKSKSLKNLKSANLEFVIKCYEDMNIDIPKKENGRNKSKKDLVDFISNKIESDLVSIRENIVSLSLKCYGKGPLQLLTDPKSSLIKHCKSLVDNLDEEFTLDKSLIQHESFQSFKDEKVLCVIYDEELLKYSFILINLEKLYSKVESVKYTPKSFKENGKLDKYEVFKFYDDNNDYIFEVRYGEGDNNALQRGLWTKTNSIKNSSFDYLCNDIEYVIDEEYLNNYKRMVSGL